MHLPYSLDQAFELAAKYKDQACTLQDDQMTIDCFGNVQLCCAVFDSDKFTVGNYLETPLDPLQTRKRQHSMCASCAKVGGHIYATFGAPEFDRIAADNITPEQAKLLDLGYERAQKTLHRQLEWTYQKFFSQWISPEQSAALGRQYDRLQRCVSKMRSGLRL